MDESPGLDPPATATPPSERRSTRRRLVQSTLFSPKPPESESRIDLKPDNVELHNAVENEDEGECCGSQGKKTRARKGKTINSTPPRSKAAKKSKERSPAQSTPNKNSKSEVLTTQLTENGDAPTPNLRLEEKMIAEENSRRFAGRQIHPFFSSRKPNKRCQETDEVDNSCGLVKAKGKNIGPIHVFERDQDDDLSLDWKNWKFHEKPHISNGYDLEGPLSLSLECSVGSLCSKKFPGVLDPIGSSLVRDGTSSDEHLFQQAVLNEASTMLSTMPSDSKNASFLLADNSGVEHEVDELTFLSSGVRKSDTEQEIEFLQERSLSGYLCCTSQLENRLWTDKHRPEKAMEVCGNDESVRFMSEWLQNWYERGHHASKDFSGRVSSIMEDSDTDYDCSGSDYDSEKMEKETTLKSVLLVSGPAGSGKSAAIYACAKEQGFEIFEVNASECRNGAIVKQRFGEILECHTLTRSLENNAQSQSKIIIKSSTAKMTTKLDNEVVQVIPLIDDDDNSQGDAGPSKNFFGENNSNTCKGQVKPLILFEDVDITFQEDRGLLAAIQQIAEKAKGPVILTSNNYNPELPANLNRSEVCFTMPSEEELLRLVHAVCSAEKNNIESHFLDQLIKYCQGDIRKTIMHLQFWCQGRQFQKDREAQRSFCPLLFDAEVGHWILPKMIPWDLPSKLSELIEKEITMALTKMNENNLFMEVIEEDFDMEPQNNFEKHTFEEDNIAAKKKAMLSRNYSEHDCDEITVYFDDDCDLLDSSGAPVSGFPRNNRRKFNVVMSDSEDEIHNLEFPMVKQTNDKFFHEIGASAASSPIKNCFRPSVDLQICVKAENLVENHVQCSEATDDLHVQDSCKSIDVSCVPESSFVPETEVNETEVSFSRLSTCPLAEAVGDVSVNYDFKEFSPVVGADSLDELLTVHKDFEIPETCRHADSTTEEVEDSLTQNIESVAKEYQLMDECSRMDFNGKSKPIVKLSSCTMKNLVQESWKKLRERQTDLRRHVLSEKDASGFIKLAYHMSNLISEADLLIAQSPPLDSAELPAIPEASDASSWRDEHLQMMSTIASHGFDLYAKKIADEGSRKGSESMVNFTWKILASSKEVTSFVQQDFNSMSSQDELCMKMCQRVSGTLGNRDCFLSMIQAIIPLRSHMTLRGDAFYEYLSSLRHISRSEDSRLSEGTDKRKCRRGRRAARNYLSNGSLAFSIDDIALLSKSNIYGQTSCKSSVTDAE